jgi:hypothetical protein
LRIAVWILLGSSMTKAHLIPCRNVKRSQFGKGCPSSDSLRQMAV